MIFKCGLYVILNVIFDGIFDLILFWCDVILIWFGCSSLDCFANALVFCVFDIPLCVDYIQLTSLISRLISLSLSLCSRFSGLYFFVWLQLGSFCCFLFQSSSTRSMIRESPLQGDLRLHFGGLCFVLSLPEVLQF